MSIHYRTDIIPDTKDIITLYEASGLPRPTNDAARIERMYANSNLVVSAWKDEQLVGVCRCITDWSWCCYLSDLAVDPSCKKSGIGRALIDKVKQTVNKECMILLLSVPTAFEYYPKVGFSKENRAFSIARSR